ncbi:cytochrome c biogenesis CcdA family protein [Paracoccus denitrificans]|jgi:cytochrome c-type biogenesis protein|uniref:Cytochrome c biogenesis protein, transmembrane region n=1 Tax=Paracoccus denitrificans (strain Pd 1222) TaxID=318586 RepID=A1B6A6_PARDP|nr:cytochrome c biogenesis protein CcdA [Paracoccus denitrificans]ABL71050.1 cytochrome c biogenesis protein, transmembrane region [Paracoccus denitrificans PD1222]MBB4629569.1 cytochrome c-type biogenesis protein [Paracoccus denitrificans]MCU7431360.1 cytochrome C biogenesis protein CcdA [Paracoccus denitrificans]QAR27721.1 cytochrome C biogenesis protein CcdA [Paracoccus denitrificans]UPV97415.1 cytochrome C biogenesis protein CcdA [Paracoccus denitrificans]
MLGIELADAAFLPAATVALLAGILSFLSPCVLPIVPPYLAYMTGVGVGGLKSGERSAVVPALFFVMGLSTVFLLMGMAASAFGRMFLQWQDLLARGAGVVVILLGLHFLHIIRIPFLDAEARIDAQERGGSALGAYALGLAFAFGWTPCIGPQLGMILSLAATGGAMGKGTALLAVYALGLGIPFLLSAIFINRAIGLMNRIKPHLKLIERVMGGLLVVVGAALLTGAFPAFAYWLLETFPWLAALG